MREERKEGGEEGNRGRWILLLINGKVEEPHEPQPEQEGPPQRDQEANTLQLQVHARGGFTLMQRHQTFVQNCRNAIRNDPIQNKPLLAKILATKLGNDFGKLIVLKKKALVKLAADKKVSLSKAE